MTGALIAHGGASPTAGRTTRAAATSLALEGWRELRACAAMDGRLLKPLWGDIKLLRDGDREAAPRVLAAVDAIGPLQELRELASRILEGRPDFARTVVLVANTLDCYPAGRLRDPAAKLDTCARDLVDAGFGVEIIARGLQLARASSEFPPGPAEMLRGCAKAREEAEVALGIVALIEREAARARKLLRPESR